MSATPESGTPETKEKEEEETDSVKTTNISFIWSRSLPSFLALHRCTILVSSYKTNLVFGIGEMDKNIVLHQTQFERPMESCILGDSLVLAVKNHLIHAHKMPVAHNKDFASGAIFDANFLINAQYYTGDLEIHDIAIIEGSIYFISTQLNSICKLTPYESSTFDVIWKPPFITKVSKEDRCHLNSFCVVDKKIKYATAMSETDFDTGWRGNKVGGGVVIDVENNEIVARGLNMPHSIRFERGKIYLLDSGTGYLGWLDLEEEDLTKRFKRLVFLPGFIRSMDFVDNYAVIGLSNDRHEEMFSGLPLADELEKRKQESRCEIKIVNLDTLDIEAHLWFKGAIEIYGLTVVKNSHRLRLVSPSDPLFDSAYTYKDKSE